MSRVNRLNRASRSLLLVATSGVLMACAGPSVVQLPAALQPPAGEIHRLTVGARGVQIYECRGTPGAWVFVAPEAQLLDGQGRVVGSHGAGPHWLADDGSRLVGSVKARADAPQPADIPWLLLATTGSGPQGRFSGITSIQRIHTAGGIAPAGACSPGAQARVPYTANYRLFGAGAS